jgi:hypothetical protein
MFYALVGVIRLCESYFVFSELPPDLEVDLTVENDLLFHDLDNPSQKAGIVSSAF